MRLSSYFSREGRSERALKKNLQRAVDKHAQSPDRLRALEALRDDGSPEAILGLMRRFSMRYDKSIEDEQEKEWVYQVLCGMGERILPQLRQYMRETDTLALALKVLEKITHGEQFRQVIAELCEQNDNSYVRDPSKKIQLLHFMGEHRDPELARLLLPYLEDMNEGVRYTAVESLLQQRLPEVTLVPLLRHMLSEAEESRRIKVRIAEGLAQLGQPLPERREEVAAVLPDLLPGARLDAQGRIRL
ncbi:MAG: HEAT repeat domain-containing protein [Myxococcales bacterium]|nr:HEAT repeat domain-containing protein [Myxococcota bacterium]MDW8280894.1 HEAT repeat domain-containing protein [Myxococcales bacterium]